VRSETGAMLAFTNPIYIQIKSLQASAFSEIIR
jgi:hypothetical protein